MNKLPRLLFHALIILIPAIYASSVSGQDSAMISNETTRHEIKEIDLARISLESTAIIFSLTKELREIISSEELAELQSETDALAAELDSVLKFRTENYLEMKNIRSIKNSINFWKQQLIEVLAIDNKISTVNKILDKNLLKYAHDLAAWNDISKIASEYHYGDAAMGRINQVNGLLDSAILILTEKSNITLGMLDKTSDLMLQINERIDRYDKVLISKQRNIFISGHPSLIALEYSNPENWNMRGTFQMLHRGEIKALGTYFSNHPGTIAFHFFLIIVLVILFIYLRKTGVPEGEYEDANYRRSLKIILSNPGNSALILGLFASTLLYPNKPVLFLDIFKLLVSIPIAITLLDMAHRKYWSVIIAFEILIILQIINANLPTHLVPARLLLLLTAIIEVITLISFIRKVRLSNWERSALQRIVLILCYVHLGIAIAGFFTNVAGKVILTQSLLNAVSGTALATVLIFLAMLVGNGLMMLFIDSNVAKYIRVIRNRKAIFKDYVTRLFQLAAFIFMFYYIMEAYGFEVYLGDWFLNFFGQERTLGAINFTWSQVAIFFIIIWISVYVSKLIKIFLEEEVLERMELSRGLPNTIALLVRYTLVTLGILAAASAAGLKMSNLTIVLGALSVGIGFGLQNIFNNLVSGLILLLERPIKIGDTIEIGPLVGVVKKIGFRASNVKTFDGAEIIVPNGNLISSEVINWTLSDQHRRIEVLIGVAYGTDPYHAQAVFAKVLASHREILSEPKPNVLFNNLGDSALEFRLLFWTDNFDEWIRIRSEVIFMAHTALYEAGIEIPFPQRDLHIKSITPDWKDVQDGSKPSDR